MNNNYITLDKSQIPDASKIIASEFEVSPVISYIFPEEEVKQQVLPLIFENLLTIYQEIANTYIDSNNIDFTFSLVNTSKAFHDIYFYTALLKTIPTSLHALFSSHIIDASKRLYHIEKSLREAVMFVANKDNFLFLSSIAAKDKSNENAYLDDMVIFCINEAKSQNMTLMVETESMKMVELYKKHGFRLGKECKLPDVNAYIYILIYE